MGAPPGPAASRWQRLSPADGADFVYLVLAALGLLLTLAALVLSQRLGFGGTAATFGVILLVRLHGSTPAFAFLAAALYLTRRGRTIGPTRRWVWSGFAVTLPLWFLLGLPITVRGLGNITGFVLLLNVVGALLMAWGVRQTLSGASGRATS